LHGCDPTQHSGPLQVFAVRNFTFGGFIRANLFDSGLLGQRFLEEVEALVIPEHLVANKEGLRAECA
jgi:hypothetical protein